MYGSSASNAYGSGGSVYATGCASTEKRSGATIAATPVVTRKDRLSTSASLIVWMRGSKKQSQYTPWGAGDKTGTGGEMETRSRSDFGVSVESDRVCSSRMRSDRRPGRIS